MKKALPIYQIDAFAEGPFTGNPAAVCPLEGWLSDETMQAIAEENNFAETAFFVEEDNGYHIRWFTPEVEVNLCGHATLATGYVLFNELGFKENRIAFNCKSGQISVAKEGDLYTLDFPIDKLEEVECPSAFKKGLCSTPVHSYRGVSDYLLVFKSQKEIEGMKPDFEQLSSVDCRGCIVTAVGDHFDVICRGFFPQSGINEDPATGSAQTTLAAYWKNHVANNKFSSCQLSSRKGFFNTVIKNNRVHISGKCNLFLKGKIYI